ncbi:unnamed protein product [Trypanosoma congolense IL3000]|uniref:WGS project CAEQ00000000 data, annotated contig 1838 n=1 Tax=Trypanosoma congolense (strain IL3000) TaxID=1068625 RepID=F9W993_TRYCI|nr:unnamed protein product [Trypanosoma congolense IL3000]
MEGTQIIAHQLHRKLFHSTGKNCFLYTPLTLITPNPLLPTAHYFLSSSRYTVLSRNPCLHPAYLFHPTHAHKHGTDDNVSYSPLFFCFLFSVPLPSTRRAGEITKEAHDAIDRGCSNVKDFRKQWWQDKHVSWGGLALLHYASTFEEHSPPLALTHRREGVPRP